MNRALLIALAVIAGLVALGALSFGGVYNSLVAADEGVSEAWAQVENVYQRRADLIPNLVSTVKGVANFEKSTFVEVTYHTCYISAL